MHAEVSHLNEGEAVYIRARDKPSLQWSFGKGIRHCMHFAATHI